MEFEERLNSFVQLGYSLGSIDAAAMNSLYEQAGNQNAWFTPENIKTSLTGVSKLLREDDLRRWLSPYNLRTAAAPKTVGLILAGNIPLAGFHDILTVLITGNTALIKPSSKDAVLTDFILRRLVSIEPRFRDRISYAETLKNFDAIIATGSDNTSRYFEYYFGRYPSVIRKNRTSCAIITGDETPEALTALGKDIFTYFGLGCRNVSKLFVPRDYNVQLLFSTWEPYSGIIHHHKYFNNYEYQKAILIINKTPFVDGGFVLLTASDKLVSPVSTVYYEEYSSDGHLGSLLANHAAKIQCTVGTHALSNVPFGEAQFPKPADYADGVDTVQFLLGLA